MIHLPLQINVDADQIQHAQDSLKVAAQTLVKTFQEDPHSALQTLTQNAIQFGLKVLAALAVYIIGAWVIKRIKVLMNRSFTRKGTDKTIASFANSCVSVTLSILLIILCVSTLGINTTSFAALLAAGGMAIGMALSGTLQNFAGGIMLLIFKPFKAGDYIEAQGYAGTVTEVNICATKIVTVTNEVIIIPNGALSSGNIMNYSNKEFRRVDVKLPFAHGTDTEAAMKALEALAAADERVLKGGEGAEVAAPFTCITDIDVTRVEISIRMWVRAENYWPLTFDFRKVAYAEIEKQGFKLAVPKVDILK